MIFRSKRALCQIYYEWLIIMFQKAFRQRAMELTFWWYVNVQNLYMSTACLNWGCITQQPGTISSSGDQEYFPTLSAPSGARVNHGVRVIVCWPSVAGISTGDFDMITVSARVVWSKPRLDEGRGDDGDLIAPGVSLEGWLMYAGSRG